MLRQQINDKRDKKADMRKGYANCKAAYTLNKYSVKIRSVIRSSLKYTI